MQTNPDPERSAVETPYLVAALMWDGTASIVWAQSRQDALEIVASFKSGEWGAFRALTVGEADDQTSQEDIRSSVQRRLLAEARVH